MKKLLLVLMMSAAAWCFSVQAENVFSSAETQKEQFIETININTADAATLQNLLKGVGSVKAKAIVAFRELNGPFQSLEELGQVKGIGEQILAENKARIVFE